MSERTALNFILDKVATILVVAAALAVLLRVGANTLRDAGEARAQSAARSTETVSVGQAPAAQGAEVRFAPSDAIGSLEAAIGIVEYVDFECAFCARFAEDTWPALRSDYVTPGRALMVFKQLPLQSHQHARHAAASALCAAEQGRLSEMHDSLFRAQQRLDSSTGLALARSLGLHEAKFETCSRSVDAVINEHIRAANAVGIAATPSFVLGRILGNQAIRVDRILVGAQSLEVFREAIDDLLASTAP